jgi:hypothetical protein
VAAGILTGDFLLRLPLDDFWPNFHLAPYAFAGFGGIILGNSGEEGRTVSETFIVTGPINNPNISRTTRQVTLTGRAANALRNNLGTDRCSAMLGADLNIALLPISGFSAKLVMTSPICLETTLSRLTLASDTPSKQK